MKKLEMAKQKGKEIAQKGKEIWDKNKVFIGIVGGAVLYAVTERIIDKAKGPGSAITEVYSVGINDKGYVMREHTTTSYRFGLKDERDEFATRENVEKMIKTYQKVLELLDEESNRETED